MKKKIALLILVLSLIGCDKTDDRGFYTEGQYKGQHKKTKEAYNEEGYDINGYDKNEFDINGIDKNGYDKLGFDKDGLTMDGYNRDGYNKNGFDRNGKFNDKRMGNDAEMTTLNAYGDERLTHIKYLKKNGNFNDEIIIRKDGIESSGRNCSSKLFIVKVNNKVVFRKPYSSKAKLEDLIKILNQYGKIDIRMERAYIENIISEDLLKKIVELEYLDHLKGKKKIDVKLFDKEKREALTIATNSYGEIYIITAFKPFLSEEKIYIEHKVGNAKWKEIFEISVRKGSFIKTKRNSNGEYFVIDFGKSFFTINDKEGQLPGFTIQE